MTERPGKALFISFEGIDGSGKSTQKKFLAARLKMEGYDVFETVEPGGTPIGEQIREILLDRDNRAMCATAELMLYFAARTQNVEQSILPALTAGRIVLTDRFTDSSLAYQGYGRGLGEEPVVALDTMACRGLRPDVTFLFDIDLETSLERARSRGRSDRIEAEAAEFRQRVRDGYLLLAAREPQRFVKLDGSLAIGEIAEDVWKAVEVRLK